MRCSARRRAAAQGGARDAADHFLARGGAAFRELRHLLLPTLHAVNDRVGWISRGAINYIAERLDVAPAEIYGVATLLRVVLAGRATRTPGARVRRPRVPRRRRAGRARPAVRAPTRRRASARASGRPPRSAIESGDPQRRALFAPATPVEVRRHRRWRVAGRRGARDRRRPAGRRRRPVARAAATCRPGRPDQPRRLPGDRRLRGAPRGRSPSDRPRSSARSPTPGSSAAAARRSRPDASGTPSPASRPGRTIWSATPTSRSPERSRTAC